MKKVFMFAGQGCQFFGMGRYLYENNESFRRNIDLVDDEAMRLLGYSIKDLVFDKNRKLSEAFVSVVHTSIAIFMFEYAAAQMMIESGIVPDVVMGSSLGEVSSLVISEAISMKEAVKLLIEQAQLIEEQAPRGSMVSVFTAAEVFKERKDIFNRCELVAVNHQKSFVVAGSKDNIEEVLKRLKAEDISYQALPVDYAFHSSEIDSIYNEIRQVYQKYPIGKPKCEMLSGVTGTSIHDIDKEYCWQVIRRPIQFKECIISLKDQACIFIDLSPDGELAGMLKYILPECKDVKKVGSIFNMEIDVAKIIEEIKMRGVHEMKAYVFPGQGSQVKGMGEDLFDEFDELTKKADRILGYSIKELCLEDSENKLSQTEYTQPALFVVSALSYLKKIKDGESEPDYLAGHSIGEYAALFAAGAFDFETGVRLVKKRGELMSRATGGGMAAVVGLTKEEVKQILDENNLSQIDIANMNTPTQIVLSGMAKDIERISELFVSKAACRMYKVLNVSGAFHSRYMQVALDEFREFLKGIKVEKLRIPVISNVYARPYKEDDFFETLAIQLVSSVQWTDSIRYLMAKGVKDITQVGPGRVAQGMVRHILNEATPLELEVIEAEEAQERALKEAALQINKEVQKEVVSEERESNEKVEHEQKAMRMGNALFKKEYGLKYAYAIGGMNGGISGEKMVIEAGKAGLLSFYGTSGMRLEQVERAIGVIQNALSNQEPYGFNVTLEVMNSEYESALYELLLKHNVNTIEVSSYVTITKPLVKFRLKGVTKDQEGNIVIKNKVIAKLSRPEVAEYFMSPPPRKIVEALLEEGEITKSEADLAKSIPMAYDICVEGDCGGYTDTGNMLALLPTIIELRDKMRQQNEFSQKIRIGAAGGIGTPAAAAAMFMMGADFIVTGSINQCTVEANTSETVKQMLSTINVQDTGYAPTWDMYESNNKVQILKRGTLFWVRSNKLYALYSNHDSLEALDQKTSSQIQTKYFKKSFEEVYEEVQQYTDEKSIAEAENNPKLKMALIFKWYINKSLSWAKEGDEEYQTDYQVLTGPALGAFNQWVKGSNLEEWQNRHASQIGIMLMEKTATYLEEHCKGLVQ